MEKTQLGQLNGRWLMAFKALLVGVPILTTACLTIGIGVGGYLLRAYHDLDVRVAAMEANRFTSRDGTDLLLGMLNRLENHAEIAGHRVIVERVQAIEKRLTKLEGGP